MTKFIRFSDFRHRLPAAIALLPICAMAWLLIFHVPVGRRSIGRLTDEVSLEGNSVVRTERLNWVPRRVAIDLGSGKSTALPRNSGLRPDERNPQALNRTYTYTERVNSRGEAIRLSEEGGSKPARILVEVQDAAGSVIVDKSFRYANRPILVGDDYLVSSDNQQLEIRDLRNIDSLTAHPVSQATDVDLQAIDGHPRFIRHVSNSLSGTARVELYEVIDGKLRLMTSWSVESAMNYSCHQGKIFTWKQVSPIQGSGVLVNSPSPPAHPVVEVRDASGHLTKSVDLPEPFVFGTGLLGFRADTVLFVNKAANSVQYFDPLCEREIKLPERCALIIRESAFKNGKLRFSSTYDLNTDQHVAPYRFLTYDRQSGEIEADLQLDATFGYFEDLDSGNFLLISSANGFSVIEVSADGSEVVRVHAPYAWAGWMMPLTVVLFVLWAIYWVRCSIRDTGWAWIDCALIGGFPLVCVWQRPLAVESDALLLVYQLGIFIGLLSLATAWLAMGKTRASLRFLVVAIIVSLGLRYGLRVPQDEQIEFPEIVIALTTAIGLFCFASIGRLVGLRCVDQIAAKEASGPARASIVGFFWTSLGIAILATGFRSLESARITGSSGEITALVVVGLCCGLLMLAAVVFALARSRILAICTGVFSVTIVAASVALPWSMFVYGLRFHHFAAMTWAFVPAGLSIPFAATFLLALPYRLRGWRIAGRRENTLASVSMAQEVAPEASS